MKAIKIGVAIALLFVAVKSPVLAMFCIWLGVCALAVVGAEHVWANRHKDRWKD